MKPLDFFNDHVTVDRINTDNGEIVDTISGNMLMGHGGNMYVSQNIDSIIHIGNQEQLLPEFVNLRLSTENMRTITFATKPPLGIIPRKFHEENRITEIMSGIERYLSAGRTIPEAWVDELSSLLWDRIEKTEEA